MLRFRVFACLGSLAFAGATHAAILITAGPGNFQGDEILLYNESGLLASGPMVQGITNQSRLIVDIYDAGEDLITPPGGQARVEAADGGLNQMALKFHDPTVGFGTLIWNLNAVAAGSVTLTIEHTGGPNHVESFSIDQGGENFFRIEATAGDAMTIAHLNTSVDLQNVKQIRIGGAVVPEPTTWLGVALGLAVLAKRRRR